MLLTEDKVIPWIAFEQVERSKTSLTPFLLKFKASKSKLKDKMAKLGRAITNLTECGF